MFSFCYIILKKSKFVEIMMKNLLKKQLKRTTFFDESIFVPVLLICTFFNLLHLSGVFSPVCIENLLTCFKSGISNDSQFSAVLYVISEFILLNYNSFIKCVTLIASIVVVVAPFICEAKKFLVGIVETFIVTIRFTIVCVVETVRTKIVRLFESLPEGPLTSFQPLLN